MTKQKSPPPGWYSYQTHSPYTRSIGQTWEYWDVQTLEMRRGFFAAQVHTNAAGMVHGGLLMTFADSVMARNVWHAIGRRGVTLQMNCNFLAPVREGQWVEAVSTVERATESTVFLKLLIRAEKHPCFSASGIFRLRRKRISDESAKI